MKFELDEQTQRDLAIFQSGNDRNSVLNLFNRTITFGGCDKLKEIFDHPLTDAGLIKQRILPIQYLLEVDISFKIEKGPCDFIEFYLSQANKPTSISKIRAIEKRILYYLNNTNEYYIIESGIKYTLQLLNLLGNFTLHHDYNTLPQVLQQFHNTITATLSHADFSFTRQINAQKPGAIDIARADHLFRYKGYTKLRALLDIVYQLDVFTSVASSSKTLGFSFPVIKDGGEESLLLTGLFHPFIQTPVPNNVAFTNNRNICFVTGTNMAGKSTLLKAIGICVFLSQIGFPVPASSMETSVFNGLITTINLSDNITQGSSHFYSEVLRVKHVAQKMAANQNMLVIFDELFRGTNVKDAFDASLSIITAFARVRNCFFVISTHIVEVANELAAIPHINFKYMETLFDNGSPAFSYQLKDGITDERLGMWIVKNEGIIDMIESIMPQKEE